MKAYIVSLGCPKNLTDAEVLMGKLASSGYSVVDRPSKAEIIIINTCAFLGSARAEAIETIKQMKRYRKKVYLAGCLPKWIERTKAGIKLPPVDGLIESLGLFDYCTPRIKATPLWTAYVKIAEGCNNCCSYCLIPTIRGRLKVRKMADVLKEVELLAKKGAKEIIYVAQDTTAYPDFPGLLKKTARIKGIRWIRILYAHPSHITDRLIGTMASEKKVVKYIDMPIQHVNDAILKNMNRKYGRKELEHLISRLRKRIPGLALRTSVIVGFPGEGEKEFSELQDFIEKTKFDRLGVFKYEREEGTPAAKLGLQAREKVKGERYKILMEKQAQISKEINRRFIGKKLEVLVEGKNYGRSYRDAPEIDGRVLLRKTRETRTGDLLKVIITGAKTYDLIAG